MFDRAQDFLEFFKQSVVHPVPCSRLINFSASDPFLHFPSKEHGLGIMSGPERKSLGFSSSLVFSPSKAQEDWSACSETPPQDTQVFL